MKLLETKVKSIKSFVGQTGKTPDALNRGLLEKVFNKTTRSSSGGLNGGTSRIDCTEEFPQLQIIDKITKESKKDPIDEFFLKQKYLQEGLSSTEIAKLTFSSRPKITRLLKHYDIPLKTFTRRNNGGHVFGNRRFGGKVIEMKKEQEVIKLIKSHRDCGYSYQKIADLLNEKKIETKMRKGFWYSKVVRAIYLK